MHGAETFEIILALLGVVIALHWAAQKAGLPPATALLVGGGALAFIPGLPPIELDPEFVLVFFLPPLLMDGAYYTALGRFRRHLPESFRSRLEQSCSPAPWLAWLCIG